MYPLHVALQPEEYDHEHKLTPEQNMLYGMLERSALDLRSIYNKQNYNDAIKFFHHPAIDEPFCFRWVCAHLNLDPEAVKRRLIKGGLLPPRMP